MGYVLGVIILIIGILVSIALHEVGHMVPAKLFGVRVSQYMVGFGKTLWSRTRGETEYGIKAIPLGGYVRLIGMYPPAPEGSSRSRMRSGRIAEIVEDTRALSAEEVRPGEEHRAFYNLSAPKKLVVMLGGPVMNLVIAIILTGVVMVGFGSPVPSTTVDSVVDCLPTVDSTDGQECAPGAPAAPAALAGLRPGDTILEFAGQEISGWQDLTDAIAQAGTAPTSVVVERASERLVLEIEPESVTRTQVQSDGSVAVDADGNPRTSSSTYIGIVPTSTTQHAPLSEVPGVVWYQVEATVGVVATLPVHVWNVVDSLVTGADRSQTSIMSVVGVGRVAGEIGSVTGEQITLADRAAGWISLVAALNVALFAFNLIPLLPLDGGHVVGAIYEGARRQFARLRGRPRPGPADTARMMPLAYGVFFALIALSAVLIIADLVSPIALV